MGRVMTEALVPTSKKPKIILTIVMDGAGDRSTDAWPDAWPIIKGLAARGVAVYATRRSRSSNRDGRLSRRDRNRRLSP